MGSLFGPSNNNQPSNLFPNNNNTNQNNGSLFN